MKKFYSFFLLLTMLLFTSNTAYADFSFKLQWETAGSIGLSCGINTYWAAQPNSKVDVSDQTEWSKTIGTYDQCAVIVSPESGYALTKAVQNEDNSIVIEPNEEGKIVFCGTNGSSGFDRFNSNYADKSFTIYCEKLAQDDQFTVNVVNGLDYFKANFSNGSTFKLEKGEHTYAYNAEADGTMTITLQGVAELYSVTHNGTSLTPVQASLLAPIQYKDIPVANGSNLVIQAFENPVADAPETCKVKFEYGNGMEGCILNIRDWTVNEFIENDKIVDNTVDIQGYTNIQINFVPKDYKVTNVYLDGVRVPSLETSSFDGTQKIRFNVPNAETATIRIEGTATVYGNINFTGYISGAEGVEFSESYNGPAITMPEGKPMTDNIYIDGFQMNGDNAEVYNIAVSEKIGKVFFRPKAGYYIANVYTSLSDGGTREQHSGAASIYPASDGKYFYMIVKKLEPAYTFDVTTTGGTYYGKLTSSNAIIGSWENPEGLNETLNGGTTKTVSFVPGYSVPAVVSVSGDDSKSPAAYLDGAALTGTLNSNSNATEFTFTPYSPKAGDGIAEGVKSDVQVYLSTSRPTMSGTSLVLEGNAQAEMYYSPVRHAADPAGQALIAGTQVIVKPIGNDLVVKYHDQIVALDENGEYVFNVTGNARNNVVTVAPAPKYSEIVAVDPASGETVKKISQIKVVVPILDEMMETMLSTDETKIKAITLTNGTLTYSPAEMGEPQTKYDDNYEAIGMEFPLLFTEAVTAAGEYTLTIPEGTFYETAWNDAAEAFAEVANGYITKEYTATYTVDANAVSPIEDYTVSPANGSELEAIDYIYLTFNKFKYTDAYMGFEYPETVTMTCGELEQECMLTVSEENMDVLQFVVVPIDEDWMDMQITTPGVWTLMTDGISYKGESVSIHLNYTVTGKTASYTITPEPGTTVDNLSEITITFPDATTVDYNELPIILKGAGYEASSTDVHRIGSGWTVSFRNPTADGDYTVTFPAGAFTVDGEASEEATATYTFESAYVLTPESGSTLDRVEIVIEFPRATNVEFVGNSISILFTNNSSYASPSMNCVKDATASVPTFVITLPSTAQQPALGNYNLIIEEGAFEIDGKASAAIFAEYTIEHAVSANYLQSPDATIVYNDWGINFAIIFDETASITTPAKSAIEITLNGETVPANAYDYMVEGSYLIFMMDPSYNKEGVLTLKIAEGAFKIGAVDSPVIEAKWDVVAPKTYVGIISPAENDKANEVGPIEVAYINFPDATSGEVFNEYGISLRSTDYSYYETGKIEKVETAQTMADGNEATGVTFAVKFSKATKSGTYILTAREGTFTLDGAFESPELSSTYYINATLTGISNILTDGCDKVTVVTVDGKVLYNNADTEVLKSLETGFYIVNGQKLYIKK